MGISLSYIGCGAGLLAGLRRAVYAVWCRIDRLEILKQDEQGRVWGLNDP